MLNQKKFWMMLACLVLLTSSPASAKISNSHSPHNQQLQHIEKPLGVKIALTTGGLGLMGIELWWFIFSKSIARVKNQRAGERK
jgi:plastocyanin domain-containing protein